MTDSEIETRLAEIMQAAKAYTDDTMRSLRWFIALCSVGSALLSGAIKLYVAHVSPSLLPSSNSQSVNVGSAPVKEPARDWLTTAEVAERERVAPRTVQGWISAGEIPAERDGREYRIPANYSRRLSAADSRYQPQ